MARSRKPVRPRRDYLPSVATETLWLESDSYDRRAWSDLTGTAASLGDLLGAGERLVPHFGSLVEDLFLALFKYNLTWNPPDRVRSSAILNRKFLQALIPSVMFSALKERTLLEEDKAAIAAIVLAEQALESLRSEKLLNRREILDLWALEHQEEELQQKIESLKSTIDLSKELEQGASADRQVRRKMEELRDAAERAAQVAEARLNQKAREIESQLDQINRSELQRLALRSGQFAAEIDQIADDSRDFGREFGQGGRVSASERLELGRRLGRNRKIGELARMVGRFKREVRALKHRTFVQGAVEAYDIQRGSEIGRLVPSELLAMRHPALARDFRRRLIENEVLQYHLRDDREGGGPMVVCVDVSSSMQGDKELWAKAVSLTLMDIARRQRRLFCAILFSSGEQTLRTFDLNHRRRYQPELAKVLDMAEYFPGGGTDFETPLAAALELIERQGLKRADIVMITDGEASLDPAFVAKLRERKQALQFSVFSILIDVASSWVSTLAAFSDMVTSVRKLTGPEGVRDMFIRLQT
jgi:uncharacterized protein with von Willebrand factor type A (vWA) domain